jgi:hypothetical protein
MDMPKDVFQDPDDGSDTPIEASVHRRVTVAVCWALARRAALDSRELFEDSYAITEEFREWLLTLENHPEWLQASLLMVPRALKLDHRPETDGLLEI